jgi:hypothetical protein
LPAALTAKQFS